MLRASWFALNRPVILAAIALLLVTGCASSPSPAASSSASAAVTVTPAPTVAATAPSSSGSAAAVTISVSSTGERNKMLVSQGATLYTNSKDPAGSSNCTGTCLTAWPPLTVKSGETVAAGPGVTGTISTFVRPDGPTQVTYNGKALYYYSGDTPCKTSDSACGEVNGQGLAGVWSAATP